MASRSARPNAAGLRCSVSIAARSWPCEAPSGDKRRASLTASASGNSFRFDRARREARHQRRAHACINRRAREHEPFDLAWKTRRVNQRETAADAETDDIHGAAEIVDRDVEFGQVCVEREARHVGRGAEPVRHVNQSAMRLA